MPARGFLMVESSANRSFALVCVEGLTVHRGDARILHEVDLHIAAGPPFAIVGESGSGKTTLLLAMVGLLPKTGGTISLAGRTLEDLSPRARAGVAGMVFQDYQLFPHLTVQQNLTLAPGLHAKGQTPAATIAQRASTLLTQLNIDDLASRFPHELSGGQKQRVAIARSLMLDPQILFFDEPSAALDSRTTDELATLLRGINPTTQIVIVSHDWAFIRRCCERGAVMASGAITQVSEGDDFLALAERASGT